MQKGYKIHKISPRSVAQTTKLSRLFWVYRYRVYTIVSMIVLTFLLFASNNNIPPNVPAYGFTEKNINFLFTALSRNKVDDQVIFVERDEPQIEVVQTVSYDFTSQDLALKLKQIGVDSGVINTKTLQDLNHPLPVTQRVETISIDRYTAEQNVLGTPLQDIYPAPQSTINRNFIQIPDYTVNAPVIYAKFEDMFGKNEDGTINFNSVLDTSDINSPLQKRLQDGVVHIPFTPFPGDIGNSYIVGHSSNFAFIRSDYNQVFKPIERKGEVGEEFIIYDVYGRELTFRIFETKLIEEGETAEAYKRFGNRRVVTLQTSVVSFRPQNGLYPYQRWLVRGELVCPNGDVCGENFTPKVE